MYSIHSNNGHFFRLNWSAKRITCGKIEMKSFLNKNRTAVLQCERFFVVVAVVVNVLCWQGKRYTFSPNHSPLLSLFNIFVVQRISPFLFSYLICCWVKSKRIFVFIVLMCLHLNTFEHIIQIPFSYWMHLHKYTQTYLNAHWTLNGEGIKMFFTFHNCRLFHLYFIKFCARSDTKIQIHKRVERKTKHTEENDN